MWDTEQGKKVDKHVHTKIFWEDDKYEYMSAHAPSYPNLYVSDYGFYLKDFGWEHVKTLDNGVEMDMLFRRISPRYKRLKSFVKHFKRNMK